MSMVHDLRSFKNHTDKRTLHVRCAGCLMAYGGSNTSSVD
jgi:hypothetical protein